MQVDNANFSKLCRDCPELLDARFTKTDVDLIFVKAKKKGERRINYTRFLDALGMIAIQKFGEMVHTPTISKTFFIVILANLCEFVVPPAAGAVRTSRPRSPHRPAPVRPRVHRRQSGA